MLVELAVGDAYGAGFEYADPLYIQRHHTLENYVPHPKHQIKPGCYTDDTQMSIALAEAIVAGDEWVPERLAQRFLTAFQRDPREGYASGFYHFLHTVHSGQEFLSKIRPDSDKSGAAMRACPIGVFPNIPEVIERATIQARITHDTPNGIAAAIATALMTHYFLYQVGPKEEVGTFLERHVLGEWDLPWTGKVKSKGWMSVRAAITAVKQSDSMSSLLKNCIAYTGDVDTVATIALGAASCSQEIRQDLPTVLLKGLEDGPYGRTYLSDLDQRLLALVR